MDGAVVIRLWPATPLVAVAAALSCIFSFAGVEGASFIFENSCEYTVWPGVLSNGGWPLLADGGFELPAGKSQSVDAPAGWSGRFWGRTGCSFNDSLASSSSTILCITGDCGGRLQCSGTGAALPATLAEITLASAGTTQANANQLDFYDVSLVDGFNIPIAIAPLTINSSSNGFASSDQLNQHTASAAASATGNSYTCQIAGCTADLNYKCPTPLQVLANSTSIYSSNAAADDSSTAIVGCKSACDAFQSPQYCCTGAYANPNTCQPSFYSQLFKHACPRAYSYAYDDATSTFTCLSSDYSITFCPNSLSQKSGTGVNQPDNDFDNSGAVSALISISMTIQLAVLSWWIGTALINLVACSFAL